MENVKTYIETDDFIYTAPAALLSGGWYVRPFHHISI